MKKIFNFSVWVVYIAIFVGDTLFYGCGPSAKEQEAMRGMVQTEVASQENSAISFSGKDKMKFTLNSKKFIIEGSFVYVPLLLSDNVPEGAVSHADLTPFATDHYVLVFKILGKIEEILKKKGMNIKTMEYEGNTPWRLQGVSFIVEPVNKTIIKTDTIIKQVEVEEVTFKPGFTLWDLGIRKANEAKELAEKYGFKYFFYGNISNPEIYPKINVTIPIGTIFRRNDWYPICIPSRGKKYSKFLKAQPTGFHESDYQWQFKDKK